MSGPEGETLAKKELRFGASDDETLPDTAEVIAQRERRARFDDEWNAISELLSSVPLEPLVVNVSTKPDDDEAAAPVLPRTVDQVTDDIVETVNSAFKSRCTVYLTSSVT